MNYFTKTNDDILKLTGKLKFLNDDKI